MASGPTENELAEDALPLLRALGYEVERLSPPTSVPATLLEARISTAPLSFRIILICVENTEPPELTKVLRSLRPTLSRINYDRIVVLTEHPTVASAHLAGFSVSLIALDSLRSTAINFRDYVRAFLGELESPESETAPIFEAAQWADPVHTFVELRCLERASGKEHSSATDFVLEWIAEPGAGLLFVIAGYGAGKTSLSLNVAYRLNKLYAADDASSPAAIYVPLGELPSSEPLQAALHRFLVSKYQLTFLDHISLESLTSERQLILVLDGLDELIEGIDRRSALSVIRTLVHFAQGRAKVVVTCRDTSLTAGRDLVSLLSDPVVRPPLRRTATPSNNITVELLPLTPDKFGFVLDKRGIDSDRAMSVIESVYDLRELAKTPILLVMIADTLDELVQSPDGPRVTPARLYDLYTQRWLRRDDFRSALSEQERSIVTEELAWALYSTDSARIPEPRLRELLRDISAAVRPQVRATAEQDLEEAARTHTFLGRSPQGEYFFTHRSFLEFFVAKRLTRRLSDWNVPDYLPRPTPYGVIRFLQDLLDEHGVATVKRLFLNRSLSPTVRALCIDLLIDLGRTISDIPMIFRVCFARTGREVFSTHADGSVRCWRVVPFRPVWSHRVHDDWVRAVAVSQDGRYLATGGWDRRIVVSSLPEGTPVAEMTVEDRINAVCFDPSGERVILAGYDNAVSVWEHASGRVQAVLRGHTANIRGLAVDATGTHVISGGFDGTIRRWSFTNPEADPEVVVIGEPVTALAGSLDGATLVVGTWIGEIIVLELPTLRRRWIVRGHSDFVNAFSLRDDAARLVSCSDDRTSTIWDTNTGQLLASNVVGDDFVIAVGMSPDGEWVVTGGYDAVLKVWDSSLRAARPLPVTGA